MTRYEHTQTGYVMVWVLFVAAYAVASGRFFEASPARQISLVISVLLLIAIVVFYKLTITIEDGADPTIIRERVIAGDPPAFPLISDALGWSLQTRMLMRVDDAAAWTGSGPRTAEQIIRWLTNIRKTIAGGELADFD